MGGFGVEVGKTCVVKVHVMEESGGAVVAVRHLGLVQSSTGHNLQLEAGHLLAA